MFKIFGIGNPSYLQTSLIIKIIKYETDDKNCKNCKNINISTITRFSSDAKYKIYPYIFLLFHYSYFYYVACLQNEILKYSYATILWPKLEGTKTFFFFNRIYNIHFKEPLAWRAGDQQQTDWASLRWFELRVANGVSNTVKPNFNGEGNRWWKHGHCFGTSWSLLLRGQGAAGMADWGIKGSEDLGVEWWVSSMCHPGASETAELCSCQLLQQQIWLIRLSALPETGINSTVQLDQNICKL